MGFPTANIQVPDGIQVPADGVYEGLVLVDDTVWPAAVNVGLPPTYADDAASAHLEANLIGYAGVSLALRSGCVRSACSIRWTS